MEDAKSDGTHKCRPALTLALATFAVDMTDRQELIRNAVAFLTDPKVSKKFVYC